MWNKIFNIVICCLPPLYLATKATCPLCIVCHSSTFLFDQATHSDLSSFTSLTIAPIMQFPLGEAIPVVEVAEVLSVNVARSGTSHVHALGQLGVEEEEVMEHLVVVHRRLGNSPLVFKHLGRDEC